MGMEILGWILDCITSIVLFVLIGYLISIKFKRKRKTIIIISVLLAVTAPTANLLHEYQTVEPLATSISPAKKTPKTVPQQTKLSKEELQNLFDKVIHESNGGVLDISFAQQGDTIEVDVKVPKEGWDNVDDSTKQSMVSQIGKGLELSVMESTMYTPGKEVYVAFMSDSDNDELANYYNQQITINPRSKETVKKPPNNDTTVVAPSGTITVGSSEDDVKRIQGVPTSIIGDRWGYGLSRITFTGGTVSGWSEIDTPLKVNISKTGQNLSAIGLGDSKQDVVNVMGTPTSIIGDQWGYGLSRVTFDGDRVSGWSEVDVNLKVK